MSPRKAVVEHVPVVRHHEDLPAHVRAIVVFDVETGKRIGHSPHCAVEQTSLRRNKDGSITTTLKITPIGDQTCS